MYKSLKQTGFVSDMYSYQLYGNVVCNLHPILYTAGKPCIASKYTVDLIELSHKFQIYSLDYGLSGPSEPSRGM